MDQIILLCAAGEKMHETTRSKNINPITAADYQVINPYDAGLIVFPHSGSYDPILTGSLSSRTEEDRFPHMPSQNQNSQSY